MGSLIFLVLFSRTALTISSFSHLHLLSAYSPFLLVFSVPPYHPPIPSRVPFPLSHSASRPAIWTPLSNAGKSICKVLVHRPSPKTSLTETKINLENPYTHWWAAWCILVSARYLALVLFIVIYDVNLSVRGKYKVSLFRTGMLSELDICEQYRYESYPSPLPLRMFAQIAVLFLFWQRPKAGSRKRLHPDGCHFPRARLLFTASRFLMDTSPGLWYERVRRWVRASKLSAAICSFVLFFANDKVSLGGEKKIKI